ncbi:hypothetical protein EUTSA_v10023071mg, partial [Eutrema salsugineum]
VTRELLDMVTFMEENHKRKSDGVFVCKKAELIAKRCRDMEQQILTQQNQNDGDALESNHLTQAEIDGIFGEEVQVMKGQKFGYGSIPVVFDITIENSTVDEELYMETRDKLNKAEKKIEEMDLKLQDVDFWISMMQNRFSDQVPPSRRATKTVSPDQIN